MTDRQPSLFDEDVEPPRPVEDVVSPALSDISPSGTLRRRASGEETTADG